MPLLFWIILFTALGGVVSALAASLFLLASDGLRARVLPHLVSFATGALLAAALLGLLPHAIESAGAGTTHGIGLALLIGLLIFFVLEKMVLWHHCHQDVCEGHLQGIGPSAGQHAQGGAATQDQVPDVAHRHTSHEVHGHAHQHFAHGHATTAHAAHGGTAALQDKARDAASASLILIGDGFHNVLDGVLIAAAFMTDLHLGIVTAIAVMTHEIPQEVGDLAILLHSGMSRVRALILNTLASVTSVIGGVVAYYFLGRALHLLPYAIAVAAASFLYIAVADLIPGLHRRVDPGAGVKQFVFIVLGVAVIYCSHALAHW